MLDLDREVLTALIDDYRANFSKNISRELYKWRAVACFQRHWDIEAEDFAAMLSRAFAQADRLIESRYRYPCRVLMRFAEFYPEDVRSLFRVLYDESRPLALCIQSYIMGMDMLVECVERNGVAKHFQTYHTVSVALWLRYPDNCFIYKYNVTQSLLEALGIRSRLHGVDAIIAVNELYGAVAEMLRGDEAYRSMLEATLDDACYEDRQMVTSAIDFAEYVARYRVRYSPSGRAGGLYASWDDAIVHVLGGSAEAMSSGEIAERIIRDGLYNTRRHSPKSIVSNYLRENVLGLYQLERRGHYALSEFGRARYLSLVGGATHYPMNEEDTIVSDVVIDYATDSISVEEKYAKIVGGGMDNESVETLLCDYFSSHYPDMGLQRSRGVLLRSESATAIVLPRIYNGGASHSSTMAELYERMSGSDAGVGVVLYLCAEADCDISPFDTVVDGRRLVVVSLDCSVSFYEFKKAMDRVVEAIFA